MYMKKTIRRCPPDVKALMRIANGIELELKALKREIEARRDAQVESHERLGDILETGQLFHHDDGGEVAPTATFRAFDDLGDTPSANDPLAD